MTNIEKKILGFHWKKFTIFLGNIKSINYESIVNAMLENYHTLGCNMGKKVNFLYSYLDKIPKNLGDMNEKQGERFH